MRRRTTLCLAATATIVFTATAASATPSQSPDASLSPKTNGRVEAVVYLGDKVLIGGSFTQVAEPGGGWNTSRKYLAAFDAGGNLLPGFTVGGPVLSLATDGTNVYAGGQFTGNVEKFTSSGAAASGFTSGVRSKVSAMAYSSGKLYVGGTFGAKRMSASTGALDGWSPSIKNTTRTDSPNVRALHVVGDSVYIGGYFQAVNGQPRRSAAKVTTSGALTSWNPRLVVKQNKNRGIVYAIQTGTTGGSNVVFLCGDFAYVNGAVSSETGGTATPNLAAVNTSNGDMMKNVFWETTDGSVNDCLVAGRTLYVTGHFDRAGGRMAHSPPYGGSGLTGQVRHKVAAFDLSRSGAEAHLAAWSPALNSVHGGYAVAANGARTRLSVGGEFCAVNGNSGYENFAQFVGAVG